MRALKALLALCTLLGGITAAWQIVQWSEEPSIGPSLPRNEDVESPPEAFPPTRPEAPHEPGSAAPRPRSGVPTGNSTGVAPDQLGELVNRRVAPSRNAVTMAIVLDGDPGDVEILEAKLVDGLSTPRLQLIPGYFRPAFKTRGFFRAAYDGDTEILARSGALEGVDRVLLGRMERSCRSNSALDADLVSCTVRLHYKAIDRTAAIVSSGSVSVVGAGFSDEAARDRSFEMLVEQHGERLISFD